MIHDTEYQRVQAKGSTNGHDQSHAPKTLNLLDKGCREKDTLTGSQIKIQQENMSMISTKNAISPMLWMITSSQDFIQH